MIWIFQRDDQCFRIETSYDNDRREFVLIMHRPNGVRQIERFKDTVAFQERLEVLETQLEADRWRQAGPVCLHEGWRIPG